VERRTPLAAADSSIRVSIDKVDAVINLVGELITTQSMLSALGADFEMSRLDKLHEALDQLDRNTRDSAGACDANSHVAGEFGL
jgi:two-component system chemotaxis sensor kinase CheA